MYDLIVIGGGAAALSATAYALGKQLKVLMVYERLGGKAGQRLGLRPPDADEADYLVGHILVHTVAGEELPVGEAQHAGEELMGLLARQLRAHPAAGLCERVVQVRAGGDGFEVVTLNSGKLHAHAVIVATGVMPYRLDVPGAAEYLGHGLGYSATTYARQLEGKRVAVIGNTLRALRGAAEVAQGAQQVYLLPGVDGAGDPLLEMMRRQPNVAVLDGYEVVALDGATYLERLVVAHGDELQALAVDAAFADLGLRPNSLAVRELAALDAEGFVVVDARQATSVPGLFAAGDVATSFGEQLLIATGDGARAALGAYDYLLAKRMLDGLGGRD